MPQHAAVFGRYLLFQVPGMLAAGGILYLLVGWTELTPRLAWLLFGLWVLKDLCMFPVTRIAYETPTASHGTDALLGAEGIAQGDLGVDAAGWVRVGAELWRARPREGAATLPGGSRVRIVAVQGLTLVVEAV